MFFTECPFCHKRIFTPFFLIHQIKHTTRRSDGQMNDHITMREDLRYTGSLEDVPQHYLHPKCGVVTTMPEEIIRSYLANPFLYSNGSFCCGCNDYVPYRELFWIETQQSLKDYFQELQREHRQT